MAGVSNSWKYAYPPIKGENSSPEFHEQNFGDSKLEFMSFPNITALSLEKTLGG